MFHFPAFPPHSLYIQLQVTPHNMVRGSPIRKSWPQRPVIDSTRLIADSHVLHRLLMPRHPPCALKNFQHNHPSITDKRQHRKPQIHEQQNNQQNHKTTNTHTQKCGRHLSFQDARVHYTVPKQQPHTPTPHTHTSGHACQGHRKTNMVFQPKHQEHHTHPTAGTACLLPQNPTVRHNLAPQAPPPAFQPQAPTKETHGVLTSSTTHSTKPDHNPHTQQCTDHDR